jgi:hypothetical protein
MTDFNDTASARANTLKYVYEAKMRSNLAKATPLLTRLQRVSPTRKDPSGKGWVFDTEYGRHGGVGARGETGSTAVTLPPAGSRTDVNLTYYMKSVYGRTNWTGQTIVNLKSQTASFDGTGTGHTMDTLIEDVSRDVNRMFHGTGFGHKAMVASASTATETVYTDSASNYTLGYNACRGTDWLWNGLYTDIVDFTAGTSMALEGATEAGGKLSAVTSSACTMATDPDFTEAAGDFIINYGAINAATSTAPVPNEPFGLAALTADVDADDVISYSGTTGVTTGTYGYVGGLDISTYPWWEGNVVYNGTTTSKYQTPQTLSLFSMQKAYYASIQKKNNKEGSEPTAAYCRWPLLFAYGDVCLQMKAINDKMDLDGGWFNLTFNGMPIIADNDSQHGKIIFVNEPDIVIFEPKPIGWLNQGEGIMHQIANSDAWEAAVVWYLQLGCYDRSLHTTLWNADEWS